MQILSPKRGKILQNGNYSFLSLTKLAIGNQRDRKSTFTRSLLLLRMQAATLLPTITTNERDKRLKLTFPTTYFPPENYFRNRKVPENFGTNSNITDAITTINAYISITDLAVR